MARKTTPKAPAKKAEDTKEAPRRNIVFVGKKPAEAGELKKVITDSKEKAPVKKKGKVDTKAFNLIDQMKKA